MSTSLAVIGLLHLANFTIAHLEQVLVEVCVEVLV